MSYVYVLRLMGKNRHYIGKTANLTNRISAHFNGSGSRWTKLHQPVEVVEVFKNCDGFYEDYLTKQYMARFGIENVRGGSYCAINLNDNDLKAINKEFDTALNRCFVCGKIGHMSTSCPNRGLASTLKDKPKYNIPPTPKYLPPLPEENIGETDVKDMDLFIIDREPDYSLLKDEFIKLDENPLIPDYDVAAGHNNPISAWNSSHPKSGSLANKKKWKKKRFAPKIAKKSTLQAKKVPVQQGRINKAKKAAVKKAKKKAVKKSVEQIKQSIEDRLKQVMKDCPQYEKVDFCIICFQAGHKPEKCPVYDHIYGPNADI